MGHYAIVGGGITGLAAAWEFLQLGHQATVLEADDRLGGKVFTEARSGFRIEHGPDSVISYRPAALQLITELGLADSVIKVSEPRLVNLRVDGRLEEMPSSMGLVLPTRLGPFARTRVLSPAAKLRAGADLVLPRVLGESDMSIGELLRRRLGPGIVARFADPLLGGVYGASVDELSVDAVLPMLRTYEQQHRSLMLASLSQGRAARRRGGPAAAGSPFRSLWLGMGSLVQALADQLRSQGVTLRTGTSVTGLVASGGAWQVHASGVPAMRADGVLIAAGARPAARLLTSLAPNAAGDLQDIPMGSTAAVTLGYDRTAFRADPVGHGWLEAGPQPAPISGVTISSNKWENRAPEGKVLMRAFVPDRIGELAGAGDEQLTGAVVEHVSRVLAASKDPELVHVRRWTGCMPKYVVGHRERVARIESELATLPGLGLAGSAVNGVGLPDCISDARAAARRLAQPQP